jgi:hypothetical protein
VESSLSSKARCCLPSMKATVASSREVKLLPGGSQTWWRVATQEDGMGAVTRGGKERGSRVRGSWLRPVSFLLAESAADAGALFGYFPMPVRRAEHSSSKLNAKCTQYND